MLCLLCLVLRWLGIAYDGASVIVDYTTQVMDTMQEHVQLVMPGMGDCHRSDWETVDM